MRNWGVNSGETPENEWLIASRRYAHPVRKFEAISEYVVGEESTYRRIQVVVLDFLPCGKEAFDEQLKLLRHEARMGFLVRAKVGLNAQMKLPAIAEREPNAAAGLKSGWFFKFS